MAAASVHEYWSPSFCVWGTCAGTVAAAAGGAEENIYMKIGSGGGLMGNWLPSGGLSE